MKTLIEHGLPRVFISRLWIAVLLFATGLILGLILLIPPRTFLLVKEGTAGRELAATALDEGGPVEVEYVHSMYGVRQKEVFSIGPGPVFRLVQVEFGALAAAIYYDANPPSGVGFKDGVWVIKGEGKSYPVLTYRVSAESAHTLSAKGKRVDLSRLSTGGDGLIRLSLERRSRLSSIFR